MVHIVEIVEDALPERMNQMRVWLDHQRYAPSRFQVSNNAAQSTGCRVYFEAEEEAAAFAAQFDGRVLSALTADAASEPQKLTQEADMGGPEFVLSPE